METRELAIGEVGFENSTTGSGSEWEEYFDDTAQAKYWFNQTTGEVKNMYLRFDYLTVS